MHIYLILLLVHARKTYGNYTCNCNQLIPLQMTKKGKVQSLNRWTTDKTEKTHKAQSH